MARFGQLYLQKGLSAPDKQLVSSEWIEQSVSPLVDVKTFMDYDYTFMNWKYGFL